MKLSKLLLAAIGAAVLLSALAGGASARTFSTSSQTFRTAFSRVTFRGAFGNIACPVTLEGSLHRRTIAKVANSLIGLITSAEMGTCGSFLISILREGLPWHLRYDSFFGVLPNITSIVTRIVGMQFRLREPLITCLATSTGEAPAFIVFNREISSRTLTTAELDGTGIETTCGRVVALESDRVPVTVLGSATRITVTLI